MAKEHKLASGLVLEAVDGQGKGDRILEGLADLHKAAQSLKSLIDSSEGADDYLDSIIIEVNIAAVDVKKAIK